MNIKFQEVSNIGIPVKSSFKAAEWYRAMLGAIVDDIDEDRALIMLPGLELTLWLMRVREPYRLRFHDATLSYPYTVLTLVVSESERALAWLAGNGVSISNITRDDGDLLGFTFDDLDGNQIGIIARHE